MVIQVGICNNPLYILNFQKANWIIPQGIIGLHHICHQVKIFKIIKLFKKIEYKMLVKKKEEIIKKIIKLFYLINKKY